MADEEKVEDPPPVDDAEDETPDVADPPAGDQEADDALAEMEKEYAQPAFDEAPAVAPTDYQETYEDAAAAPQPAGDDDVAGVEYAADYSNAAEGDVDAGGTAATADPGADDGEPAADGDQAAAPEAVVEDEAVAADGAAGEAGDVVVKEVEEEEETTEPPKTAVSEKSNDEREDLLVKAFVELLETIYKINNNVASLAALDHNVYGNLEYLARIGRNIAHVIVWSTLSEDHAGTMVVPLEMLVRSARDALQTTSRMKANHGGLFYSAKKGLGQLEQIMGVWEAAHADMTAAALRTAGSTQVMSAHVAAALPAASVGVTDLDLPVEQEGSALRLSQMVDDAAVFAKNVNPEFVPDKEAEERRAAAEAEAALAATEQKKARAAAAAEAQARKEKEAADREQARQAEVAAPVQSALAPAAGVPEPSGVAVLASKPDSGPPPEFKPDTDHVETTLATNCRNILKGCHTLISSNYTVYGNLEHLARVTYNFAAPLLCLRPDQVSDGDVVEEPLASAVFFTAEAKRYVEDMVARDSNMFKFAKYHLGNLEKVYLKLELLSENMYTEFMEEGLNEIVIGSASVHIINLDDPVEKEGAADRLAKMVSDLEVVCRVVSRRRATMADDIVDEEDEDEVVEEEDEDEGEEGEPDDDFVDVAADIQVEDGELVAKVKDMFEDASSDRWYFLQRARLADALLKPLPSSLYVTLRSMHDASKFLRHHLTRVLSVDMEAEAQSPSIQAHRVTTKQISDRASQLTRAREWTLLVTGPDGSGKSTLINSMLGFKAIPATADVVPSKCVPILVTFGSKQRVGILSRGKSAKQIDLRRLPIWLREEEKGEDLGTVWTSIEIQLNHKLLQYGLSIMELPEDVDLCSLPPALRRMALGAAAALVTVPADGAVVSGVRRVSLAEKARRQYAHLRGDLRMPHVAIVVTKLDVVRRVERAAFKRSVLQAVSEVHKENADADGGSAIDSAAQELLLDMFPGTRHGSKARPMNRRGAVKRKMGLLGSRGDTDLDGDSGPGRSRVTPNKQSQSSSMQCVFVSAQEALSERHKDLEAVNGILPPPDQVADVGLFIESGVGVLENWLSRVLLLGDCSPYLLGTAVPTLTWSVGMVAGASALAAHMAKRPRDEAMDAYEEFRPTLEMLRLKQSRLRTLLEAHTSKLREYAAGQADRVISAVANELAGRGGAGGGGLAAFDGQPMSRVVGISDVDVEGSDAVRAAFDMQWARWGGILTACVCRAASDEWCSVLGQAAAAVQQEAAGVIGAVRVGEKEFVGLLELSDDALRFDQFPDDLTGSMGYSAQLCAELGEAVMKRTDEAAASAWPEYLATSTAGGSLWGALTGASKTAQAMNKAQAWVDERFGNWLAGDAPGMRDAVADALLVASVRASLDMHDRVGAELTMAEVAVEAALDITEEDPEKEVQQAMVNVQPDLLQVAAVLDTIKDRSQWIQQSSFSAIARSKAFDVEAPATEDEEPEPNPHGKQSEGADEGEGVVVDGEEAAEQVDGTGEAEKEANEDGVVVEEGGDEEEVKKEEEEEGEKADEEDGVVVGDEEDGVVVEEEAGAQGDEAVVVDSKEAIEEEMASAEPAAAADVQKDDSEVAADKAEPKKEVQKDAKKPEAVEEQRFKSEGAEPEVAEDLAQPAPMDADGAEDAEEEDEEDDYVDYAAAAKARPKSAFYIMPPDVGDAEESDEDEADEDDE